MFVRFNCFVIAFTFVILNGVKNLSGIYGVEQSY